MAERALSGIRILDLTQFEAGHEVMAIRGKAGVPCGATPDTGEILDDPHLNARGQIHTIEHATRGRVRLPGCPVHLSASEAPTSAPAARGTAHRGSVGRGARNLDGRGGETSRAGRAGLSTKSA